MNGFELRTRRVLGHLPGYLICLKAGITRSRLSDIENGYVQPSGAEVARISAAVEELIAIRKRVDDFAAENGWPDFLR
jgi:transcriptional regulator with XRE-family HTH domain